MCCPDTGQVCPVTGALGTIFSSLTGKEQTLIDCAYQVGSLVCLSGLRACPRSQRTGFCVPGCCNGAVYVFANIVTEDIGDPVNGKIMTRLLALFLEPNALTSTTNTTAVLNPITLTSTFAEFPSSFQIL
jgi:hypothetical protein